MSLIQDCITTRPDEDQDQLLLVELVDRRCEHLYFQYWLLVDIQSLLLLAIRYNSLIATHTHCATHFRRNLLCH